MGTRSRRKGPDADMDYATFRQALASFWTDAYVTKCGMVSPQVLKPLPRAPTAGQWTAWTADSKHPVAQAVKAARSVSLAQGLSGWLASLQDEGAPKEVDGVAVGVLLVCRFLAYHLDAVAALRAHMGALDDAARAKVWAAIENMSLESDAEATPLQSGIAALYTDQLPTRLCDALYCAVCESEGEFMQIVDSVVDCIKDLVDMASVCAKPATRPKRGAARAASPEVKHEEPPPAMEEVAFAVLEEASPSSDEEDAPMIDLREVEEEEPQAVDEQEEPQSLAAPLKPPPSYSDPVRSKILQALRETQAENRRIIRSN